MAQSYEAAFSAYQHFEFAAHGYERRVYRRGSGPAVVIVHEIPGPHPLVIRFADRVAAAGMTVFLPILFGTPGKPVSQVYMMQSMFENFCVRREFNVWKIGKSSPIVDYLRALAERAHGECGGRGVGTIGMCFTGGFALAMATSPSVVAPVISQPALPFAAFSKARAGDIDVSPEEFARIRTRFEAENLCAVGLRFKSDKMVPPERFDKLRQELGSRFEAIELEAADAPPGHDNPHSVLTIDMREDGPTKAAEGRVIAFLKQATAAA